MPTWQITDLLLILFQQFPLQKIGAMNEPSMQTRHENESVDSTPPCRSERNQAAPIRAPSQPASQKEECMSAYKRVNVER
mmetsp:Transcript_32712/g.64844  ORF Transcript_32712/g.64844 Transcript_32712/m.64844 type:complete len:80 (-) Transcript_32712:965-1204(-)